MSYGLRVENESGNIQIDQDYSSLYLREKNTVVTRETGVENILDDVTIASFTVPSGLTIIAFSCTENCAPYSVFTTDGVKSYQYLVWGPAGTSFTYYVFGREPPPALSGFGLEVYKNDGGVAFSSSYNYFKPVEHFSVNTEEEFIERTIDMEPARDYAICASRVPWRKTVAGSHLLANQVGTVQKRQSDFIFNFNTVSYFATGGEARYSTASDPVANYLLVDVTGF